MYKVYITQARFLHLVLDVHLYSSRAVHDAHIEIKAILREISSESFEKSISLTPPHHTHVHPGRFYNLPRTSALPARVCVCVNDFTVERERAVYLCNH